MTTSCNASTITHITITEGAAHFWGTEPITTEEAAMRQAAYQMRAAEVLAAAWPDAEIEHEVANTAARLSVLVRVTPDEDGNPLADPTTEDRVADRVREILGATWEAACEADCRDDGITAEDLADEMRESAKAAAL